MLHFKEINDIIERTGFPEHTHLDGFHIIKMIDSGENFVKMMPPHSQDFFQIGFQSLMIETEFSLQTQNYSSLKNLLYFVAPHQAMSWVVETQNEGFILYFKRDFISHFVKWIEGEFPFFQINESNLFELPIEHNNLIIDNLVELRSIFENKSSYQTPILQSKLIAFLYRCKEIYEQQKQTQKSLSSNQLISLKFNNLVQKFYLQKRKIDDYAQMLNVSPNYLSAVIKATTSQNAKTILNERLLIEAKNLLSYSDDDISSIAYQLGFEEMTHFGRFFKNETGISPSEWRKENTKS
jgi:AraC family transcriptional regulator, transcriptional activator of pobA